ncbi:MAG: YHS domain-containing protein [Armatimonadota bacterium]
MKTTIITWVLALMFSISAAGVFAAGMHQHGTKPAKAKTVSATCPVMKSKIPDVKKATGKSVYKGKTYYFCCGMCKPQFDSNPAKFVKK